MVTSSHKFTHFPTHSLIILLRLFTFVWFECYIIAILKRFNFALSCFKTPQQAMESTVLSQTAGYEAAMNRLYQFASLSCVLGIGVRSNCHSRQVHNAFAREAPGYPEGPITWFEAAEGTIKKRRNRRYPKGPAGTRMVCHLS